jgi:hypothetical protein
VWLTAIPALIILCLAAVPGPQSSSGDNRNNEPQLEGSWLVTVANETGLFESLVSYAAGGACIGSDSSAFPLYPMTTAFHGTWAKKGGREFVFTAVLFQYDNELWKMVVKETSVIEPGGDAYHSTSSTVELFGPNGEYVGPFPTTTHAVRIKAE